ncbi:MAG TPA: PEGA domain-containing protein, partial [Armatimonadota bacterium]|nr:PEGA domain-containing protein [Armatimonadota bacterium]
MRNPGFTMAALLLASLLAGCGSGVDTGDSPTDPGEATLLVRSTPAGATILVDGQPTGRVTPADVSAFAQSQESVVTLTLTGYHPWHGLARKMEGMTLTLDATLTPSSAGTGAIQLQSDPPGATVFLDNEQTAYTTPATIQNVPASQHVVEYRFAGFYPFREEVTVTPGRTASSTPVLTRLGQGRITGRVLDDQGNGVVGAQVGVRGLEVSTTTTVFGIFVLPNVPQGTYTLDAALATGDTALIGSRPDVTV